jgi:deoxyxylulose-5-phosphate synthase
LHYSLGPIKAVLRSTNGNVLENHRQELSKLVNEIRNYVKDTNSDQGGQLGSTLLEIEQLLSKRHQ